MVDIELLNDVQKLHSLIQVFVEKNQLHCSELTFLRKFIESFGGKIAENQGDSDKVLDVAPEVLEVLQQFIESIVLSKSCLKMVEYKSIRTLVESFGGDISNIPDLPEGITSKVAEDIIFEEADPEEEADSDRVDPDDLDDAQHMGHAGNIVTEEMIDNGNEFRVKGQQALSEKNYQLAIEEFTNAIKQCRSAAFFSYRASAYLALKKPNAAIKDCDTAISINPDNSKAYKIKGRAHRALGHWKSAAESLRTANKYDFDEDTCALQKAVEAKIVAIEGYQKRKVDFYKNQASNLKVPQEFSDMLNGSDEIQQLLEDPELNTMINEIGTNLDAFAKYQNHPKILNYFQKVSECFNAAQNQSQQ
eukprot:TRINITY_DN12342_c0_g1_i1.p1 TRINITY_DN12342_c0_g1~~TRINITY_DN12342_c0_g1_i1.p1  ORF type:complete len:362 (-),score=190.30 TRINITY_DN12342_c0_g1_i1:7-1092(-)